MDPFAIAAQQIIKAQQAVIGPIALDQARAVSGLKIKDINNIKIVGNRKVVLSDLVNKYENFFGQASVEVCKDAIREMNPPVPLEDLPDNLR